MPCSRLLVILLFCSLAFLIQAEDRPDLRAQAENKVKLAKTLAKDYQKLVEPGNTTLKIDVAFVCAQYDLPAKRLHTRVFERYSWTDWRLRWDPSQYSGVTQLKVPDSLIWTPHDIKLFNAFPESAERDEVNVMIQNDGSVYWVSPASYETLCGPGEVLNDRKGHCHLTLGSWTYDVDELPLEPFDKDMATKFYLDDCPHVISNITSYIKTTKYDCCPELYPTLEIDFDLEERSELKPQPGRQPSRYQRRQPQRPDRISMKCRWPNC